MSGHRTTTFAAGSHVPGASLNSIQDRAHTLDLATATAGGAPTDTLGADWITYQSPDAGVGAGTVTTLDASDRDWRERLVQVSARFVTTAARRWGRSDEHVGNDPASTNVRTALGVTGPGAVGAAAASVVDGTPPVVTAGSCPVPLDVRVDGTVWLFADPTTGALKLYNDTTTPLHLDLLVMATGRSTDPSAPPPDLVPTLTEILWLTPSVAASRPVSPGALIAIHRATDTGAVTLWDGGAWRSLGLVSPLTTRGDLWRRDGSGDARLAIGAAGSLLRSDGTDPDWLAAGTEGQVLTVVGGLPAWAAAAGATVLHASDGTAAAGSESASVSGTGAASTVTLTASATARTFGSAGQTAAGWYVDLPVGTQSVAVEVQLTAASGLATGGYRYLAVALSGRSGVSTTLCGISWSDSGSCYAGDLRGGTNAATGPYTYSPTLTAADRWVRARLDLDAGPHLRCATGTGSAGARPTTWRPPDTAIPLCSAGITPTVVDSDSARLWLYLQGFGTGGATSITATISVRVTQ